MDVKYRLQECRRRSYGVILNSRGETIPTTTFRFHPVQLVLTHLFEKFVIYYYLFMNLPFCVSLLDKFIILLI